MELELRSNFQVLQQGDFIEQATSAIKSNEDVLFFGQCLVLSGMRPPLPTCLTE